MSISGMEYQIDPEDDKKVRVQTVDNELVYRNIYGSRDV